MKSSIISHNYLHTAKLALSRYLWGDRHFRSNWAPDKVDLMSNYVLHCRLNLPVNQDFATLAEKLVGAVLDTTLQTG